MDYPYLIRNGPLRTHRELLLIRGISQEDFFGEDMDDDGVLDRNENDGHATWPDDNADRRLDRGLAAQTTVFSYERNVTGTGTERVNLKTADEGTLVARFGMTASLADKVREKADAQDFFDFVGQRGEGDVGENEIGEITGEWIAANWEELTLTNDKQIVGMINVNTASRAVLESVPGMEPRMADAIIGGRAARGGYLSLGELYKTALTEEEFPEVAGHLTIRSSVFRIVSTGALPRVTRKPLPRSSIAGKIGR